MKLTFTSPVATAEFSIFAGILSAALSQHHLSGFEIAQLEFPLFLLPLFVVMLPKDHLTSHSGCLAHTIVIIWAIISNSNEKLKKCKLIEVKEY